MCQQDGTVTLKLSLNYGVDNGNIVAVGPASCFGSGDLHKGTSGESAAQIVRDRCYGGRA